MSTMTPGLRKALIVGGIAVVLSGGGVASVWAAGQIIPSYAGPSPTTTVSPGSSSPGNARHFPVLPRGFIGGGIHGEFTVKDKDGKFTTIVTQRGTVQSGSDSNIAVKSDDGFTQSYAITSSTIIVKIPAADAWTGTQGRRPLPPVIKATDLKVGDTLAVSGTKSGTTVTATRIIAGTMPAAPK